MDSQTGNLYPSEKAAREAGVLAEHIVALEGPPELSLRERQAMMTQDDWGLLIDRELWEHMSPTERERAQREWTATAVASGGHIEADS